MINLVKNEWIKLIKKKSTWVMLGLTLLLIIAQLSLFRFTGIKDNFSANSLFQNVLGMSSVINLLVVVVASSIVAEEYSKGTIKLLLIRPQSRTSILLSKFITTLLYGLFLSVALYIISFVLPTLFFGYQDPTIIAERYESATWLVALEITGVNFLLMILYATITLLISTVIRSQSLAVGVGLATLFGSSFINSILDLLMFKHPWLKWNLFNMMNIKNNLANAGDGGMSVGIHTSSPDNLYLLSVPQMILGVLVYSLIFYVITNLIFKKQDISLD